MWIATYVNQYSPSIVIGTYETLETAKRECTVWYQYMIVNGLRSVIHWNDPIDHHGKQLVQGKSPQDDWSDSIFFTFIIEKTRV